MILKIKLFGILQCVVGLIVHDLSEVLFGFLDCLSLKIKAEDSDSYNVSKNLPHDKE